MKHLLRRENLVMAFTALSLALAITVPPPDAVTALIVPRTRTRMNARYFRTNSSANVSKGDMISSVARSVNYERAKCGDGIITGKEKCDDKNSFSKDGCSSECLVEAGFSCTTSQPSYCWDECGDGKVSVNEKCDDGNAVSDDGCTPDCFVEGTYQCSGSPSSCTKK